MKSYGCFFVILDDQYVPCKEGEDADIKASIVEIPAEKAGLISQIKGKNPMTINLKRFRICRENVLYLLLLLIPS